ncbi:WAS/WASL-interacting protein family member 3-like [Penaeus indicus]|uniref:WAS/WASL-interacting protein family member 3-like n=1 Tax=Penaeus indicus TaxID=29960 RepID=UPI00300D909D
MWKELVLLAGALAFAHAQQFDYYDYVDDPQAVLPAPPPPPARSRPASRPVARGPPPAQSRPASQHPGQQQTANDPNTTPVPIVTDIRRIDTKTGGFVYQYAGADGSAKYELRLPNGTVTGNYTFINDLGERETRWYSAGVHDPSLVDETTDPNYVDLGNYELYKHLEEPYVHVAGADGSFDAQAPRSSPRAQRPSPPRSSGPRSSAPRPAAPRAPPPPPPPPRPASTPLDYDDPSLHFIEPAPIFEGVPVEPLEPLPPVPVAPPQAPVRGGRGRAGGRVKVSSRPVSPPHRLNSQSATDAFLDDIINRFS